MLNLLIITLANESLSGGSVASRSNYEAFKNTSAFNISVIGSNKLDYATHTCDMLLTSVQKVFNYAKLQPSINYSAILQAIDEAKFKDIDVIFFDSSLLGSLTPQLRRRFPDVFFVTFFHNVESITYYSMMKKSSPFSWTRFISIYRAERLAARNSNYRIALSNSDSVTLEEILGTSADIIWPITYPPANSIPYNNPIREEYVLFVGGYYKPNLDAIDYLATRIAPRVRKKIVVAGFNLGKIKEKYACTPNIIILDSPANLAPLYQHANLVLAPIFTGGGIKTKIIEAFSFGKFVIASPQAAIGFDNIPKTCMMIANSDADYVTEIGVSTPSSLKMEIIAEFEKNYSARAKNMLLQKLVKIIMDRRQPEK